MQDLSACLTTTLQPAGLSTVPIAWSTHFLKRRSPAADPSSCAVNVTTVSSSLVYLYFLTEKWSQLSRPSSKSYDITLSGTICAQTTVRTPVSSLDSQLMVPFLPRSTLSRTLQLVVSGFPWNLPHLWDCVGISPSDDAAPLPSMPFHTLSRMKHAGLPVPSSSTQLLVRSARAPENA